MPADALNFTRSCTRIHASVTTPSVPSEPSASRSGLGPAPDPGRRRDSTTPAGGPQRTPPPRTADGGGTGGRHHADRLHEIVDVRVHAGIVTAGSRRQPAAERRELERLREVPQRVA